MSVHLQKALRKLSVQISGLGRLVEEQLSSAMRALETRDSTRAAGIVEADHEVDEAEVALEEEILKTFALYQPVAMDLRFLVSALKINNDLERIGDLSANIAQHSLSLQVPLNPSDLRNLQLMAEQASQMLREALEALLSRDPPSARRVLATDKFVDDRNSQLRSDILRRMTEFPQQIRELQLVLSISRHLERVADHATNIAEDVIYSVEGEIVRHRRAI